MQTVYFHGTITLADDDVAEAIATRAATDGDDPSIGTIIKDEIKSNLESVWPISIVIVHVNARVTPPDDTTPSSEPSNRT